MATFQQSMDYIRNNNEMHFHLIESYLHQVATAQSYDDVPAVEKLDFSILMWEWRIRNRAVADAIEVKARELRNKLTGVA